MEGEKEDGSTAQKINKKGMNGWIDGRKKWEAKNRTEKEKQRRRKRAGRERETWSLFGDKRREEKRKEAKRKERKKWAHPFFFWGGGGGGEKEGKEKEGRGKRGRTSSNWVAESISFDGRLPMATNSRRSDGLCEWVRVWGRV